MNKYENRNLRDDEMNKLNLYIIKLKNIYKEEFKHIHINGHKTNYICNNFGEIYNIKGKIKKLVPIRLPNGYYVVSLRYNNKYYRDYIHRIIGKEFIKIPEELSMYTFNELEINHKNGIEKWNNTIYNIEWATDRQNKIHGYKNNLYKSGENSHLSIHDEKTVEYICQLLESNIFSVKEISKLTNTKEGFVYDILYKGSWNKISDKYDFSKYTPKQQKYTNEQIKMVINLIKEHKLSFTEISKLSGVKIKTVYYYNKKINK